MADGRGPGGGETRPPVDGDERFLRALVERSTAALVVVEPSGRIRFTNPAAARLLGQPRARLTGRNLATLCEAEQGSRLLLYLDQLGAGAPGRSAYIAIDVPHADGSLRTFEVMGVNLVPEPAVTGLVLQLVDVTGRARLEEQLARLATTDPLTGLPNRRGLEDALRAAEGALARGELTEVAVAYVDLDGFKLINDRYGHARGDDLLRELGQRLDDAVRPTDLVSRVGGDEFFVLLHDPGRVASVIDRLIGAMAAPVPLGDESVVVGASIGVAATRSTAGMRELMREADAAQYRAKASGKGCWVLYDKELEQWLVARRAELRDLQAEYEALQQTNAALQEALLTDARTELPNHLRADRDLERAAARAVEQGEPFSVAFIDIDAFGRFNKRFGQHVGDAVLKSVADALRAACRESDTVYRLGGEEFVALFRGATVDEAARIAERMRRQVEATAHVEPNLAEPITVSIGVACFDARHHDGHLAVRKDADLAMREAKGSGRNRVILAHPGA